MPILFYMRDPWRTISESRDNIFVVDGLAKEFSNNIFRKLTVLCVVSSSHNKPVDQLSHQTIQTEKSFLHLRKRQFCCSCNWGFSLPMRSFCPHYTLFRRMNHPYSLYRRSLSVVVSDLATSWFCCWGRSPVLPWARHQGHDTDSIQPLFPSDSWLKFHAWTVCNGLWCTHWIRRNGWILIWHHLHVKVVVGSKSKNSNRILDTDPLRCKESWI